MTSDFKKTLLKTTHIGTFLITLRGERTLRKVAEALAPYGGPSRRGSVQNYEQQRRSIGAAVQLAYCRAFDLDDDLRLHLQRLAGEAAGCRSLTASEEAA